MVLKYQKTQLAVGTGAGASTETDCLSLNVS